MNLPEVTPTSVRHGRWTRVSAEIGGEDVSHMEYAPQRVQVGGRAAVRMAGIGGVGTDPAHRRRGLAKQVLAQALAEIDQSGYSSVGLYTSRRIVAHRLYRRFGLVDLLRRRGYWRVLDPGLFAQRALSSLVAQSEELQRRRLTISLDLGGERPLWLRADGPEVSLLESPPAKVEAAFTMSEGTLLALWRGDMTLERAEAGKLVRWSGDAATYRALARALRTRRAPVQEE